MYTKLIGAATVRGFKSAVISPVLSNQREGEKRNTFRDYFMICFIFSVSYLFDRVPSLIVALCITTVVDVF